MTLVLTARQHGTVNTRSVYRPYAGNSEYLDVVRL